jgi:hypothetical protein
MGSPSSAEEEGSPVIQPLQRFAAILTTAGCAVISVTIWRSVSGYQSVKPLPALYIIVMVLLAAAAALVVLGIDSARIVVVWAAVVACVLAAAAQAAIMLTVIRIWSPA